LKAVLPRSDILEISPNVTGMKSAHPEGRQVKSVLLTLAPKRPQEQGLFDQIGASYDYACRYFTPWWGVNESPATGSAQCALAPFWASILKKKEFYASQYFPNRGAQFRVRVLEEGRVSIAG
ncbi:hypothetical protein PMAYCL1PPCAC_20325, partial [Pristionchus mayeri]